MKAVILAGGLGTRISEETLVKPKPMIEIGGKPILWHILKMYSAHGINEFIICCGYKGYMIKEYFSNYFLHMSDVTFCMPSNSVEVHQRNVEPWKVTVVDTGDDAMTGGRLKRVAKYLVDSPFCFTYGDGVSDLDISSLISFHKKQGRLSTVTCVQPPGRYGAVSIANNYRISGFKEKPEGDGGWISGGFFVLNPSVLDRITDDSTVWEQEPLKSLARDGELSAYIHNGFWHPMDTLRDKNILENLWSTGCAPWKTWK